jgi:basic amino acid/polyamine antiporter, APA family
MHVATHGGSAGDGRDLPRVLGILDVLGILVGTVIGSGIFIVPATIAQQVVSPTLLLTVWLVGGVLSFFGALAFSELGAAFPKAGGMYVFLREAYGPLLAVLFGWALFVVIDCGAIATLSVAFSSKYLPYFVVLSPTGQKAVAIALIALLAAVNYTGTRRGAALQNFLTFIKFSAIIGVSLVVFVFADGNAQNFSAPPPPAFSSTLVGAFGVALVASLWAYKGWEVVTFSAGEIKNPGRNLPLGLFAGTLAALVLYVMANLAYLYVFPVDVIAKSDRIAADAMNAAIGPIGATIVAVIILFSIAGAANGNMLTDPRVFFAMARDGVFFKKLGEVHPKYLTPHWSIVATAIWSAVLSVTGTFEQLLTYVVFGQWLFFGLTAAAVIVLRRTRPDLPRPYRTWGYPVTPLLFIAAAVFIAVNTLITQFWQALAGLGLILLGIPIYLLWQRNARRK